MEYNLKNCEELYCTPETYITIISQLKKTLDRSSKKKKKKKKEFDPPPTTKPKMIRS